MMTDEEVRAAIRAVLDRVDADNMLGKRHWVVAGPFNAIYRAGYAAGQADALRKLEAAQALVAKLDEIHADETYKGVWVMYQLHCGAYDGPTYTAELDAARAALGAGAEVAK